MKSLTIAVVALFAVPAFASGDAACTKFVSAAEAAGKRVGKPYPDAFLPMLKAGCLKSKDSDAVVDKRRQCVEKAKTEAEMNACNG